MVILNWEQIYTYFGYTEKNVMNEKTIQKLIPNEIGCLSGFVIKKLRGKDHKGNISWDKTIKPSPHNSIVELHPVEFEMLTPRGHQLMFSALYENSLGDYHYDSLPTNWKTMVFAKK